MSATRFRRFATFGLLAALAVATRSQQTTSAWKDPSPHRAQFVTVDADKNVRLEVLDWGGAGLSVVLLAGGGDTAHVFDDFATKLTPRFHVYGITRRGFGESGFSAESYGAELLGKDVIVVIEALKLSKPVLAGHSLAGEEMSEVANREPSRVGGLIYLDAAYPYAFDDGTGPTLEQMQKISGPQPPPPDKSDLASFAALRQYYLRILGFTYPEGELRQQWESSTDGRVGQHRDFPGYATILSGRKKYTAIPAPALAIFAIPHSQGKWVESSNDPRIQKEAKAYSSALKPLTEKQVKAFARGVPTARVVRLPGAHHYVFLSNEADVLREMRSFVSRLH